MLNERNTTPATERLDDAVADRLAVIGSLDRRGSWYVRKYQTGGGLVGMGGPWCSARDAQRMFPEAGKWIAVHPRLWQSEDGRWLCES